MIDSITEYHARTGGRGDRGALKLSDIVYAKIASKIRSGEYALDTRLPTENEMAEWLGVSRPVVREALARLRNDGVVVSRRGSGTYVQKVHETGEGSHPPLTSIADMRRCLEFRISFEGETSWHAAASRDGDRSIMSAAIEVLAREAALERIEAENDFAFHYGVAVATGNRFFAETLLGMRNSIITAMAITPNFIQTNNDGRVARIHAEHMAVYSAVMDNRPDDARTAMRDHLTHAMNRVFDGI